MEGDEAQERQKDQTPAKTTPLETKLDAALTSLQKKAEQALRRLEKKFARANGSAQKPLEDRGIRALPSGLRGTSALSQIRYLEGTVAPDMMRLPRIVKSGQDIRRLFGDKLASTNRHFRPPEPRTNDEPIKVINALRDAMRAMIFALEDEEPDFISRTRQDAFFEGLESSEVGKIYMPATVQKLIRFISEEADAALLRPVDQRAPEPDYFAKMLQALSTDEKAVMNIIEKERGIHNTKEFREKTGLKGDRVRKMLDSLVRKKLVVKVEDGDTILYVHGEDEQA